MTRAEARLLKKRMPLRSADDFAWIRIGPLLLSVLGLLVGTMLGHPWVLAALGAAAGLPFSKRVYRSFAQSAAALQGEIDAAVVEVVEVFGAEIIEQKPNALIPSVYPIFYMDIGGERVMVLRGQTLFTHLYDVRRLKGSFPAGWNANDNINEEELPLFTTHMRIHRSRVLGYLFEIELLGEVIEPGPTSLPRDYEGTPSGLEETLLISASFAEVRAAARKSGDSDCEI
jgi:hypothetical protein